MIALLQRVNNATVYADGELSGQIGFGLYILLGIEKNDSEEDVSLLCEKIPKLRIFSDSNGKMNLSLNDVSGEVMVVSNFTLTANYSHGNRPDYFASAAPERANELYSLFIARLGTKVRHIASGRFGADMRTEMSTDGPVTIIMQSELLKSNKKRTAEAL